MRSKKAFFLFEVTLTVAILSIGLVFVIRSINMSMRVAKVSSNYSQAMNLASSKMMELDLFSSTGWNLSSYLEEEKGNFGNNENFSWEYLIEDLDEYNLSKVTLDIIWKEGKREGSFDIITYTNKK
jgi:type II secretory pathway pseudopilin PulG